MAYLTGVFLGDGCVTTETDIYGNVSPVFRLNTIDEDFCLATKAVLEDLAERKVSYLKHRVSKKPTASDNYALRCADPDICQFLEVETAGKTKLPDWIFRAKHEHKLAFIAGLMDSEGYVSQGSGGRYMGFKSTDPWFYDFIRLLNSAGIQVGKVGVEKPYRAHYRTPRRFAIKLASWVASGAYFNIQRKQRRIANWVAEQAAKLTSETNTRDAA